MGRCLPRFLPRDFLSEKCRVASERCICGRKIRSAEFVERHRAPPWRAVSRTFHKKVSEAICRRHASQSIEEFAAYQLPPGEFLFVARFSLGIRNSEDARRSQDFLSIQANCCNLGRVYLGPQGLQSRAPNIRWPVNFGSLRSAAAGTARGGPSGNRCMDGRLGAVRG